MGLQAHLIIRREVSKPDIQIHGGMMTATIRVLDTKASAKAEVVEEAKRILDMAERGEIVDLAWSASCVDGTVETCFTATDDAHRRLASVSRLLHRLHISADENGG